MKSFQSSEKFLLLSKKINRIPRHYIPAVSRAQDLNFLARKGIKVKNLVLNKKLPQDRLSTSISLSENLPKLKRMTKTNNSLQSIEVDLDNKGDISSLLKIQNKMRYLQDLRISGKATIDAATKKYLQRFLVRSKQIRAYSSTLKVSISPTHALQTKEKARVALVLKKSENDSNPQRLIVALRECSLDIVAVRNRKDSLSFVINCYYDREKKKYEQNVSILICRFFNKDRFNQVMIPVSLKDEVYKLLPLVETMNMVVRARLDLDSFSKGDNRNVIENFLSRRDAELVIGTLNYSWTNLLEMLAFSQEMFRKYQSYLYWANFTFYFHSLHEDVKQAIINYLANVSMREKQLNFEFNTNSMDWFKEDKKVWLTRMLDELCKERNKGKCSQINFEIELNDNFEKDLYTKIVDQISLVIHDFAQRLQGTKIILTVNDQLADQQNLLFFLVNLKNLSSKPLDLLRLKGNLPGVRELINQLERLRSSGNLYEGRYGPSALKTQIKKAENYIKEALEFYDDLNKLKDDGCFLNLQTHQKNQMKELLVWFDKFKTKDMNKYLSVVV